MAQEMIKLPNGKSMPALGLGTWQSLGDGGKDAVRTAISAGYRHIDTAQMYQNEAEVGEVLEQLIREGKIKRDEIFITTKLIHSAMAPENVKPQTELSVKKLRTQYIDLLLIHFPMSVSDEGLNQKNPVFFPTYANGAFKTTFIDPLATWRELEKLVDEGLVRAIGLSNFNKDQIQRIYEKARIKPANLQVEAHAWFPQDDLMEFCKEKEITFTAYSPLGSPGRPPKLLGPDTPPLLEDPVVLELASKYKRTPAQILLRNLIQRGMAVVPKSSNPERIKANFQLWDFSLTDDDMKKIKGLDKNLRLFEWAFIGKQKFNLGKACTPIYQLTDLYYRYLYNHNTRVAEPQDRLNPIHYSQTFS